ncbi:MAG TPA: hypothetical protein VF171_04775 [Trueperaceae bacterium]
MPNETDLWARLLAPFSPDATTWRILGLSEDGSRAEVRPALHFRAVVDRLDEVAGPLGWSNSFLPVGADALACTLSVDGVSKSVVVPLATPDAQDAPQRAEAALVQAAEALGMRPAQDIASRSWVDYDAEAGVLLYEPEPEVAPTPAAPAPTPAGKSAGQQAIDRLIERLRGEGLGLEAAKLVMAHGGYGSDPEAARELYAALRKLLMEKEGGAQS